MSLNLLKIVGLAVAVYLGSKLLLLPQEGAISEADAPTLRQKLPTASRAPASVPNVAPQRPDEGHQLAAKDEAVFKGKEASLAPAANLSNDGTGLMDSGASASTPRGKAPSRQRDNATNLSQNQNPTSTTTSPKNPTSLVVTPPKSTPEPTTGTETNGDVGTASPPPTQYITCNVGTGGGTFNTPQNVSLSCSSSATVRYCLAQNTCCDPDNGALYTGPISIGNQEGTYCLSFYGLSSDGDRSVEKQISYTFTADVPHLLVSHPKIRYQTTELQGKAIITSNDFGVQAFELSQINLQTHDPSLSGLDLDCDEIAAAPVTLNTPTPTTILGPLDINTLTSGSQVENMLGTTKLVYGDNYITTLITNPHFTPALRSCSTTNVILWDFEFFNSEPVQAEVGSATVREFEGGFTALGFFEDAGTVYREPAGISLKTTDDQELRTGLFGVFY